MIILKQHGLSEEEDLEPKFSFDLWSYNGKFDFKGNKKK